jgi:hypothetical protein
MPPRSAGRGRRRPVRGRARHCRQRHLSPDEPPSQFCIADHAGCPAQRHCVPPRPPPSLPSAPRLPAAIGSRHSHEGGRAGGSGGREGAARPSVIRRGPSVIPPLSYSGLYGEPLRFDRAAAPNVSAPSHARRQQAVDEPEPVVLRRARASGRRGAVCCVCFVCRLYSVDAVQTPKGAYLVIVSSSKH